MEIRELQEKYKKGELSVTQYINEIFEKVEENDLNSYVTLNKEAALQKAEELDKRLQAGEEPKGLFGVPFSLKDNILTKGLRTTAGSQTLENFIPVYDATVTEKLLASDAVLIGKANMDEYAMGSSSETSYFGPTHNPLDKRLVPGGSSAGSGANVAGGEAIFSLGSDTGGSVRNPANFCNIVGFAPSYGAISRYGVISMANSFDRVGILANTAEDVKLAFEVISGVDPRDLTSINVDKLEKEIKIEGLKIAAVKLRDSFRIEEGVKENYLKALSMLEKAGALIEEIDFELLEYINYVYTVIMSVEVSSNMARIDGMRFGNSLDASENTVGMFIENRTTYFGDEMKRRIALGNYFSSKDSGQLHYKKAMQIRKLLKDEFEGILEKYDYLITPTNPGTPYELGAKVDDANSAFDSGTFNTISILANLPAISVPVDKVKLGSIQITGKRNRDYDLLEFARLFEEMVK